MHSDLFLFILMVLSIVLPALVGLAATRGLWQWTHRTRPAGRQSLWLYLSVPLLGVQTVTSPWVVPSLLHDAIHPLLGGGILWLNVLLPLLLLAGLIVRPQSAISRVPVTHPPSR